MRSNSADMINYYRDADLVEEYHEDRYGGEVGRWFLESEQSVFRKMARDLGELETVLDIGTGTGKLCATINTRIFIGLDSSQHMLGISRKVLRDVHPVLADSVELPFQTNSIDVATASRVLMHVPNWAQMIAEACRVARRAVLLDYPAKPSFAALEPAIWRWSRGRNAPPVHRIFARSEIDESFRSAGFENAATRKGYLLPYRFHRLFGSPTLSTRLEAAFRRIGLTKRFGSPVFALYKPLK